MQTSHQCHGKLKNSWERGKSGKRNRGLRGAWAAGTTSPVVGSAWSLCHKNRPFWCRVTLDRARGIVRVQGFGQGLKGHPRG